MRRFGLAFLAAACLWHAVALCMAGERASAGTSGELAELEWLVAYAPERLELRRQLAAAYEERGLLEEAVAQHLAILVRAPGDEAARGRVDTLVAQRMPAWLPKAAEEVSPLACAAFELELRGSADTDGAANTYRLLVTREGFAAREGERWDEVHKKSLPRIDYGYVWEQGRERWVMKARAHGADAVDSELAQKALRTTLAFYCVAREYLGFDPTMPWGEPVDVWLGNRGRPGARAVGLSVYLYSVKTPRQPAEWVRQVAHEYGHVALPGIGGFTETDDPWADGHLGELLFPKWLAESGVPGWVPWSVASWETEAGQERERLRGLWSCDELRALWQGQPAGSGDPAEQTLDGEDAEARDRFLGLALHVEAADGPSFLGEVLRRCPRGRPGQFVSAVRGMWSDRAADAAATAK